jgi:hypothetical protein
MIHTFLSFWWNGRHDRFRIYFYYSVGSSPTKDNMLKITNNIVFYYFNYNKKLLGVVISSIQGWGIINYKYKIGLIKNKIVYLSSQYTKNIFNRFESLVFGFQRGYFQYVQLKGIGYKFILANLVLSLKLGFSHRSLFINGLNLKCVFVTKYLLKINSRSLNQLKKISFFFNKTRKHNIYNKKGIFIKGSIIQTKLSSKKLKF